MPLTQDQIAKVNSWMQSRKVTLRCHQCGHGNFASGDICASPQFSGGGMSIGGPTIPMLPLICQNCGNVLFFAAIPVLGLDAEGGK
jgi:hypothetical protein